MAADDQSYSDGEAHERLKTLGKFQIVRKLGAGGMGAVFLATDVELKRAVALKVLPKDRADSPRLVRRFKAEAQAVASLRHDNIVAIYEAGEIDGFPYLALEYVDGLDLHTLIQKRGVLPPKRSLKIIRQVAEALQHAYEKNIVHRDIKPSNLLVKIDGTCKLTDLGLARSVDDTLDASITRAGTTVGTIDYISPEQACDSKAADIRSDIYSLGCTWYHMLTGEPPFGDGDLQAKIRAHLQSPPPNPRQLNPNVPEAYVAVMHQMMAKRPQDRYQTPADLIADLDQVAGVAKSLKSELFDEPSEHADEQEGWSDPSPAQLPPPKARRPSARAEPAADRPAGRSTPRDDAPPAGEEPVHVPQKMKIRGRGGTESAPPQRRGRREAVADPDAEGGSDAPADAGGKTRKLPAREQKDPTGLSIDLDFARIVLIASIVIAVLGGFWWAMSRGSSWGSSTVVERTAPPVPPPPPPVDQPPEQPAAADAPLRAEAQVLAGEHKGVLREGVLFAGTDDLGSPSSAAVRRFVPDWVYAIRNAPTAGLPVVSVSIPAAPKGAGSLNAALRQPLTGRSRVVELQGSGPFPLDPEVLKDVERVVIRAASGAEPVVVFRGAPAAADVGHLHLRGGVLELEGLHLLLTSPADAPSRSMLSAEGGTIVLRRCSVTQGEESGPLVLCTAAESEKFKFPPRVLIDGCLIRGGRLSAASGRGERCDLIVGGSLLASSTGPVLEAEVRPPAGAVEAASAAAPQASAGGGTPGAPSAEEDAGPQATIRVLGSVLISDGTGLSLRQPRGGSIVNCEVQVRRSILAGGDESTLLSLPDWPARGTSVSGQPRVAGLQWRQERSQLTGWRQLVRIDAAGSAQRVATAEEWQSFWGAPLETGSWSAGAASIAIERVQNIGEQTLRGLTSAVPAELASGTNIGIAESLPRPPEALMQRTLLLAGRPQFPPGFVDLPPPPAGVLRVDLRNVKPSLNDYLNSPDVPDGAHLQLTGIGLVNVPPIHLQGKSLRLEFLQGGDGAPLVIRPDAARGEPPDASILVEDARLDLIGARIQASPSRTRNVPPRLLLVRNGDLTIRNCWLEGPTRAEAPEQPLVEWVAEGKSAARRFAYITDTQLLGSQPLLAADVDRRLLAVTNCVLASRSDCVVLRSQAGAAAVPRGEAGWAVLQHCTLLVGARGVRLTGNSAGRDAPAVHLQCTACVFAPAPGTDLETATVLVHPEKMTAGNLFDWWEQRTGYAAALRQFRRTSTPAQPEPQVFARDWIGFWTPDRVEHPVTGNNGVLFKTLVPSLEGITPTTVELMPTCAAARAAVDGGPIGARVGRIGPTGVSTFASQPTSSPGGSAPVAAPGRVDF